MVNAWRPFNSAALRSPWLPPDVLVAFDPQAKRHLPVVRHHISTQSEMATRDVEEGTDVRRVTREVSTKDIETHNVDLQTEFRGRDMVMQTEQQAKDSAQQTDSMTHPAPPGGGGMPTGDVAEGKSGGIVQKQMVTGNTTTPSKISPQGPPVKGAADSDAQPPVVGASSKPRQPFVKIAPKGDPAALAKRIKETEKRRPGIRNWADRLMCRTSPNPSDTVLLSQLKAPPRQVKVLSKGLGKKEEISMGALAAKMHIKKPALVKPAPVKPALVKPALEESEQVEPAQAKPALVKPALVKPAQAKPALEESQVEPAQAKPALVKPAQAKPALEKPALVKPALVKPAPVEPAPVEPAPVEPVPATTPATKKMSMTKKAAASKLPPKKLLLTKPGQKTLVLKKPKN